jgi:hypothetical protein
MTEVEGALEQLRFWMKRCTYQNTTNPRQFHSTAASSSVVSTPRHYTPTPRLNIIQYH